MILSFPFIHQLNHLFAFSQEISIVTLHPIVFTQGYNLLRNSQLFSDQVSIMSASLAKWSLYDMWCLEVEMGKDRKKNQIGPQSSKACDLKHNR